MSHPLAAGCVGRLRAQAGDQAWNPGLFGAMVHSADHHRIHFGDKMTAQEFAIKAHGNQKYGKTLPYSFHLEKVVEVLKRFGHENDRRLLAAGWLHDVFEDTTISWHDVWLTFSLDVADLVDAVTDRPGKNRRERHERTYPGIRRLGHRAVALKLADRIANVEYSVESKDEGKLKMYRKEHAEFVRYLYLPGEHPEMWEYLAQLLSRP